MSWRTTSGVTTTTTCVCATVSALEPFSQVLLTQFKELNSRLNREVLRFEQNTHTLSSGGGYQAAGASELEAEARAYVLGGSTAAPSANETVEERRRRLLEATMGRLRKVEGELELSCGTAPPGNPNAPN
jgi:hypothetical protein